MTFRRAIATVIACTLILAVIGTSVGYFLGIFAPGYYRGVFQGGQDRGFDPVSFGVGQGLTQGIAGGVILGVTLVAIFCWRASRLESVIASKGGANSPTETRSVARRLFLVAASILAIGFCTSCGLFLGPSLAKEARTTAAIWRSEKRCSRSWLATLRFPESKLKSSLRVASI